MAIEATALLRSEFPDARVIVLTGSTDPHLVGAALDAGALRIPDEERERR
jgi:DNA-binding NarL/FixJ family response regulator